MVLQVVGALVATLFQQSSTLHGHRWDFTETLADVAPEEWSDGAFHLETGG